MKTKIFGGIAIVVIALAVAFNVSLNTGKTNSASLLAFANVEALADAENKINDPNTGWTIFTQGATKDERELIEACPIDESTSGNGSLGVTTPTGVGVEVGGGGSSSQTNPSTRTDIRCPYGYENCTPMDC